MKILQNVFFSYWSAIPFTLWLVWVLIFDATIYSQGSVITPDVTGAFIIGYVTIAYVLTQAIATLAHPEQTLMRARLDAMISTFPLIVLLGIGSAWLATYFMPSLLETEPVKNYLHLSEFKIHAWITSMVAVVFDVFVFGHRSTKVREYFTKRILDAATKARATEV